MRLRLRLRLFKSDSESDYDSILLSLLGCLDDAHCTITYVVTGQAQSITRQRSCPAQVELLSVCVAGVVAQNCRQRGDNSFCTFTRGQDTGIKFRFIPAKPYRSLKAKVEGKVGLLPIWVPMPGSEVLTEACKDTRGATQGCPLVAGGQYEYNAQIPVSKNFPSSRQVGDVKVKYQLFGEDNQGREEVVACFEPTVRIQ